MTDKNDNKAACDARFDKVYDDTFADIRRYVAVRCADPMDLSDVLQEIYLEYYRLLRRKGIDYAEDDRAMVFTIAERKVKRYYSLKQKLRRIVPLRRRDDDDATDPMMDIPDPVSIEERAMMADDIERSIGYWLAIQPKRERSYICILRRT